MKKILYILLITGVITLTDRAFAQQPAQFSQYMFNTLYFNPAFAGVEGATKFTLISRNQWTGYNGTFDAGGAPQTTIVSLNTPVLMLKSGIGVHVVYDKIANWTNSEAQFSYAYHLPLFKGKLSMGIRAGFFAQGIDFDRYRAINSDDPLLGSGKKSQTRPDLAAGFYYRAEKYFFGASFAHLLKSQFNFNNDLLRNPLDQAAFFQGGYDWEYSGDLTITPSALIKTDFKQYSVELNAMGTYKNKFWGGLGVRQSDAAIVMLGMSLMKDNSLRLGYSFDYIIKAQKVKQQTSHEIMLSYTLPVATTNKKSIIRTPRFRQ